MTADRRCLILWIYDARSAEQRAALIDINKQMYALAD